MRVWDVPPAVLCRPHLLGEHRELHAVWTVITEGRQGYRHHPEVKRWTGCLRALYLRHALLVDEMTERGFRHQSPLDARLATGRECQDQMVDSFAGQIEILRAKGCGCRV